MSCEEQRNSLVLHPDLQKIKDELVKAFVEKDETGIITGIRRLQANMTFEDSIYVISDAVLLSIPFDDQTAA